MRINGQDPPQSEESLHPKKPLNSEAFKHRLALMTARNEGTAERKELLFLTCFVDVSILLHSSSGDKCAERTALFSELPLGGSSPCGRVPSTPGCRAARPFTPGPTPLHQLFFRATLSTHVGCSLKEALSVAFVPNRLGISLSALPLGRFA